MKEMEIVKGSYQGIHDHMIPMMLKTVEPRLRHRVMDGINPIIWMAWHIMRTEDMFFNTVMFNRQQVFQSGNWRKKLKIDTNHVGTGMTTQEADRLSLKVDLEELVKYNHEMKKAVIRLLDNPPIPIDNPLDSEKELDERLKMSDSFPEGVRQNRAKAYAPNPVSSGVIGLISHAYMHIGQYFVVTKPL